ncbi:transmembrane protein, putative, partial [Bodo saltans]
MATRNIVLCDAGAAVIGGAIDLGIVICVGDEGSIIAARSNVISNVVVVATVASFLLSLAVLWKFLHRRNDTFTNAVLMFRLPSSLLPILTAVLPSTASSTTYLLTNLINSRCIATDIVLSLCGFVLSVGPPAIIILFWQTFCRGAHSSLSCVNERKLQVEKGHTNGAIRRFIGAQLAALSARTHKWRYAAPHHNRQTLVDEETSLPLRMGWTILLEYRQLWFASLDLVIIFLAACFGVASGLEGVEQCRAFSLVVVAMFTAELVILCIARPFTTVLSAVHTATCLFLTVLSATAQLIFVFLS